jgi:hypothetical protein
MNLNDKFSTFNFSWEEQPSHNPRIISRTWLTEDSQIFSWEEMMRTNARYTRKLTIQILTT